MIHAPLQWFSPQNAESNTIACLFQVVLTYNPYKAPVFGNSRGYLMEMRVMECTSMPLSDR